MTWMPVVSQHLGLVDFQLVPWLVPAARALATASAFSAASKALAVKLETPNFGAPAAMVALGGLLLHFLLYSLFDFGARLRIGTLIILMQQAVEQVVGVPALLELPLQLEVGQVPGVQGAGLVVFLHN